MREICLYGSERGALGNQRPYRDQLSYFISLRSSRPDGQPPEDC